MNPLTRLETLAEGVVVLTLDRPSTKNALSLEMVNAIHASLAEAVALDPRVLIITGAGGAFVSGADIAELRNRGRAEALKRINTGLLRAVEAMPMPTIAAIEGYALGGGLELAMACDLRVAGQNAKLGLPEVSLGIVPGAGGTYRLPKLVGLGVARELLFTAAILSADEAKRIGLINQVAPDGGALTEAVALAARIAKNSPLAVRFAKSMVNASHELSTDVAMTLESTVQAVLFEDDEKRRRMDAFLERKATKGAKP